MRFNIQVTRSNRDALAGLAQRLRDLGPAFTRSSVVVISAAQMHIRDDGPGWPATVEQSKGSALDRTGALMRSITATPLANGIQIGTNLRTPDGKYNIGRLMQYGTGPIKPKNGKLLVFEVNGVKIFSRGTKGIPARPFLFFDQQTAQRVMGVFESYLMEGQGA